MAKQRNIIDDAPTTMLEPKLRSTRRGPAVSNMRKNSTTLKKKTAKTTESRAVTTKTGPAVSRRTEKSTNVVSMEISTIATTAATTKGQLPPTTLPATTAISNEIPESIVNKPTCPRSIDAIFVSRFSDKTYIFNDALTFPLGSRLGYDESAAFLTKHRFGFKTVDAVYRSTKSKKLIVFSNEK